jgi:hypothetical protein
MANKKVKLTPLQKAYKKELQRLMSGVKKAEKKGYIFNENKLPKMPKRVTKKALNKIQHTKPLDYATANVIKSKERTKKPNKEINKTKEKIKIPEYEEPADNDYIPSWYEEQPEYTGDYYTEPEETPELEPEEAQEVITEDGYIINPDTGEVKGKLHDRELNNLKHGKTKEGKKFSEDEYPRFSTIVISNFREDISHFPQMAEPMLGNWLNELINNYGEDDVAQMLEEAKADGIWIDYTIAYSRDNLLGMISQMMDYLPDASEQFKKDLADRFEFDEDWENPS